MSSSAGTVPIRPQKLSPQRLSTSCVLLAPAPAGSRPAQVTMAPRGPRRALPPPPSRALKRGGVYSAYVPSPQPTTVLRRNARERNRVKQVNHGFVALRNHIPGAAKNKKLSKVDTLRHAMEYIQSLQQQLEEHSESRWAPEQQPSPAYQSHPRETHFSGYLAGEESPPASLPSPGRHLTPPGYMPRHEEQHGGYLTPQSSPLPCQSSPLILTPSSLASVDSGVCVSEPLGYPAGPPQSCPDTPSPMPPGAYEGPDPAGYVYSEELACHEPDTDFNPEDEELLDAIAWWQTSQ